YRVRIVMTHLFRLFVRLPPRPPISTLFPYTTLFRSDDLTHKQIVSGASTITQQVVRNVLLDSTDRSDVSARRKIKEIVVAYQVRSEEHTSELQSRSDLVCRLLLEKKKPRYPPADTQA